MSARSVFLLLGLLGVARGAEAGPVVNFNPGSGSVGINRDQTVGWSFNVLEPVVVTHLAWFDDRKDGLSQDHKVGIWAPDGRLLVEALLPAGVDAPLDGIWRITDIEDLRLEPLFGYVVAGTNTDDSTDQLRSGFFPIEIDPRIEHVQSRFSGLGSALMLPTGSNPTTSRVGFYGPGFNVVPIPEPSTVVILSGLLLLSGWRRL